MLFLSHSQVGGSNHDEGSAKRGGTDEWRLPRCPGHMGGRGLVHTQNLGDHSALPPERFPDEIVRQGSFDVIGSAECWFPPNRK